MLIDDNDLINLDNALSSASDIISSSPIPSLLELKREKNSDLKALILNDKLLDEYDDDIDLVQASPLSHLKQFLFSPYSTIENNDNLPHQLPLTNSVLNREELEEKQEKIQEKDIEEKIYNSIFQIEKENNANNYNFDEKHNSPVSSSYIKSRIPVSCVKLNKLRNI